MRHELSKSQGHDAARPDYKIRAVGGETGHELLTSVDETSQPSETSDIHASFDS